MTPLDLARLRSEAPDCPSDYALDLLHARELSGRESEALHSHVGGCAPCGARMQERRAGFAALGEHDAQGLWESVRAAESRVPAPAPKKSRFARDASIGGLFAMAAALLLVWLPGRQRPTEVSEQAAPALHDTASMARDTVRAKGAFTLRVHLKRPSGSEEARSGDRFEPGDTLRFAVFLPAPGHVRVLGQESDGTLYTAWPLSPTQPSWFGTAGATLLPGAVQLDDSPGRETLYALLCPEALQGSLCSPVGAGAPPRCPAECEVASFILDKGAR